MVVLDLVFFMVLVVVAVVGAELVRMTARRSLVQPVAMRQPAGMAEALPVEID
jgi:hypothetical protein